MAETTTEKSQSLFIRHLAHDKLTRVQRKLRPTNKMAFLLGDGRRIRRKNNRTTEIDLKILRENLDRMVEGVEYCFIEVQGADGKPLSGEQLKALAGVKSKAAVPKEESEAPSPPAETQGPATDTPPAEPATDPTPPEPPEATTKVDLTQVLIPAGKYKDETLEEVRAGDPEYFENIPKHLAKHTEVVEVTQAFLAQVSEGKE